ncbi:MAG: prepilin-type N-terminal cleavage/methylation domain-containing protein [Kiritimatiellae bacterium]|nr:prepilin-type N-terminal cleavage/methylation domain-containing protein [Kiritimatiellia bacterium]
MMLRSREKKNGFTLVEMLIVVVVLITLMSVTFKLAGIGDESDRRVTTVTRLQRLENCLSGYQAAFGSYPPVKLHGSHDINFKVGSHDIQTDERNEDIWNWNKIGELNEQAAWRQVSAACKAQPIACRYPFPSGYDGVVEDISEEIKSLITDGDDEYKNLDDEVRERLLAGFDDGVSNNIGRHSKNKDESDWRNIQLFQFGLMSYLLPRYLFMMNGDDVFFSDYAQWTGNNTLPCDPFVGSAYNNWKSLKRYTENSPTQNDLAHVANIPSQAACARWMPNLEGICKCNHNYSFFGIDIRSSSSGGLSASPNIEIFSPGDESSGSTANQYVLDMVTVHDGWDMPFYYYSPPPYQTYTIWSGGANKRTFPPWISRKGLSAKANECIGKWTVDDIIHMSN